VVDFLSFKEQFFWNYFNSPKILIYFESKNSKDVKRFIFKIFLQNSVKQVLHIYDLFVIKGTNCKNKKAINAIL
jgi:hypothetical protein